LEIHCRPVPNPTKPDGLSERDFAPMGPCPFAKQTALPLLAVDEQIYRRLPCFLIATVDKFAALPWVGKTSALFGNVTTYQLPRGATAVQPEPAGFWGPAESEGGSHPIEAGRLLPPELIIQDELHLISGPLGTLAGLYETTIERLMRPDPDSPPPKIIASTATVRRAGAQIQALFARRQSRVFPPPGAFLQATLDGERVLGDLVRAALIGSERVADLFSGVGTFALRVCDFAETHAVEGDAEMLAALKKAADAVGGLRGVSIEKRDLLRTPLAALELKRYDAVVFDPPRSGAKLQAEQIGASRARRVAAVSCDPATFARDVKVLVDAGFGLKRVTPVDQFRWTPHVEVVGVLER
jgi:hypothetical protein